MKYWESVFKIIGTRQTELQKDVFRNLCFWDEVSQKRKDFLPTPNVYHWHPVAFVENMREMNMDLPWILIANKEIGQKEIKGGKHNPRILEYYATTTRKATTDEVAWCSSFVNWCMTQAGMCGTNSAKALSWKSWGKKLGSPVYGCIVIIDYSYKGDKYKGKGHVGFAVGKDSKNRLYLLGGNQSDSVNVSKYNCSAIEKHLTYVLPTDYDSLIELNDYEDDYDEGTYESTR